VSTRMITTKIVIGDGPSMMASLLVCLRALAHALPSRPRQCHALACVIVSIIRHRRADAPLSSGASTVCYSVLGEQAVDVMVLQTVEDIVVVPGTVLQS